MLRGFKFQVVLPVAAVALVMVSFAAIGFSFWAMQHEEGLVRRQVADNVTSVRGVFVSTYTLMDERVHLGMALLKEQILVRGGAEKGTPVNVAGKSVSDIIVGNRGQAGNFDIVHSCSRAAYLMPVLPPNEAVRLLRDAGFQAFLVGEHLMKSSSPAAALRALLGGAT